MAVMRVRTPKLSYQWLRMLLNKDSHELTLVFSTYIRVTVPRVKNRNILVYAQTSRLSSCLEFSVKSGLVAMEMIVVNILTQDI